MGTFQVNGNVVIADLTSAREPSLTLQRDSIGDTYTDWRLLASTGNLYIQNNTSGNWITSLLIHENSQDNGSISTDYSIKASSFIGNADTSSAILYPSVISTDADLDNFLEAKKFKVGQYHGFTPTGSHISSNAIVLSGGYTNDSWGFQLAIDNDPTYKIQLRHKGGSNGWCDWKLIPMADGTNASGTWGINISGVSASSSRLNVIRTLTGEGSHASNLKNEFDNYKNSIPREQLLTYTSYSYGNTSFYTGYFLNGYDNTPYGGFYVAHYNNPYYVGISYGTYTQQSILTDNNFTNWTVTKGGGGASGTWPINITGNANSASKVYGYYTGNGGRLAPSDIGRPNVKFHMMNGFMSGQNLGFMDCMLMNTYGGGDVPYCSGLGIVRSTGDMYIAWGSDTSSEWSGVYAVWTAKHMRVATGSLPSTGTTGDVIFFY